MVIQKVGVVGCGQMGSGIARVIAQAGFETIVMEVNKKQLNRGIERIENSLSVSVEKGEISAAEKEDIRSRIHGKIEYHHLVDADLVIEAVIEDLDAKRDVFRDLHFHCEEQTIFASNTSSLTITELASGTDRKDRFLGLHFFNPVQSMPLVEVVQSLDTAQETRDAILAFVESIGKTPIVCKDRSGFVVNRLLVPYLLDAVRALESRLATIEDMDQAMKLGAGYPMGPFTLIDYIGLDVIFHVAEIMFEEYKDPKFAAPPLLKQMVNSGYLGKKSGMGFYDYSGEKPSVNNLNS